MNRTYIQDAIVKLRKFYRLEKRLPTYAEFCELFNFSSKGSAQYLVNQLIAAGIIEKGDKGKLLPKKLIHIPHLGTIKAGYPMPAFEQRDDSIDVYQYIHDTTGDIYFLTVSGDSMIEALIGACDKIIVDPKRAPQKGAIVAAVVDNEWTDKYSYKQNVKV